MLKIIFEFDGDSQSFQKAISSKDKDDEFDFIDSIFWEMDYGKGESFHSTEYGDITIKYIEDL